MRLEDVTPSTPTHADPWHVYNGPAALVAATEVSVNGLNAAGFITDAHAAVVELLDTFIKDQGQVTP